QHLRPDRGSGADAQRRALHIPRPRTRHGFASTLGIAPVRPGADTAARRLYALRDERDRRLSGRSVSDTVAAARDGPGPRADEPMDQRGQFLLLPVHVLSRLARAQRLPAPW